MTTEYEPEEKPEQERRDSYDFQFTAKKLNSDQQKQEPISVSKFAFRRDFIDSLFTVVNKDLLFCKLFYFFFFGAFGSLFPLLAIYFKQLGMNASQSGVLIGFRPFIEFLSVPFWTGLADRWRRGKEMLLFAILSWVVFTLAIAFVQPPAHKCLVYNGTHTVLEIPYSVRTRRDVTSVHVMDEEIARDLEKNVLPDESVLVSLGSSDHLFVSPQHLDKPLSIPKTLSPSTFDDNVDHAPSRVKRARYNLDPSKIVNANASDLAGLITSKHSTVVYKQDEVQYDFFILFLLVIVGEFFSAPAITFADCVTLSLLGEDTENYGKQRMFGSLGWGLSMFFVGMALDHATTFPKHPCGEQHPAEKNYTVCFAVFSVLMSCAFLTALQFRYDFHGPGRDIALAELKERVKDKVKKTITGRKKMDRERLVEEDTDDDMEYTRPGEGYGTYTSEEGNVTKDATAGNNKLAAESDKHLRIKPGLKNDMVTDALKSPGALAHRGAYHNTSGTAVPPGRYTSEPFFGKWLAVVRLLWSYQYLSVLGIAWFMGFGIGIIFTFLFWHLQDLGGSPTLFGVASVINHVSELLAYFMSSRLLTTFGHVKVLYAGLLGNVARFLYISWLRDPWWVLPFEFVQGLTHAAVWASCCAFVTHAIPGELKSSAQGILQALHHGLGRGCGAVFGGLLVYRFGSEITFRVYGVTCVVVLAAYVGANYFLQRRGLFDHDSTFSHELMEDNGPHLAPHGVPSGMGRNLSSSKLTEDWQTQQKDYGSTTNDRDRDYTADQRDPWGGAGGYSNEGYGGSQQRGSNAFQQDFTPFSEPRDRVFIGEAPRISTQLYHQQPDNSFDQEYGP